MPENDYVGKRINIDNQNLKRLKIITTLLEDETEGLNEKKKLDYAINKAIEAYYGSEEIKSKLDL